MWGHCDIHITNCRELLTQVSRSFAAVIRQLPKLLVTDIVVFYLVLRGLDTVEDDMTAFDDIQVNRVTKPGRVANSLSLYKRPALSRQCYSSGLKLCSRGKYIQSLVSEEVPSL